MSGRERDGEPDWVRAGFAVMLVLIGIAAILAVFFDRGAVFMSGFPWGFLGWIFGIFILFWIIRGFFWGCWGWYPHARGSRYRRHGDSYYILKERYAKGEISRKEYEEKMRDLESY